MNVRNVLDALKLYVGESKDREHQIFVKPGIFCVTFSGWSASEAQQHKYTPKQITGLLGGVGISITSCTGHFASSCRRGNLLN
jgi:hypothetical protein